MGYMNSMQGVEIGMAGLQAGLNSLTAPRRPLSSYYRHQPAMTEGVSVEAYNSLVVEHNALAEKLIEERKKTARLESQLRDALGLLRHAARD